MSSALAITPHTPQDAFNLLCRIRDEITGAGLVLRGEPDCSGALATCGTTRRPYGTDGRYAVHLDFPPNVWVCNYHNGGEGRTIPLWRPGELDAMTETERAALRERIRQEKAEAAQQAEERRKKAAETANRIFPTLPHAGEKNAYLSRKGVLPLGDLRQTRDGRLTVPVRKADGRLVSLQFIEGEGGKRFLAGGEKQGCFFPIPAKDGDKTGPLLIGEGVATVLSACQATGCAGLAAFDAGNLLPVAEAARSRSPERELVLLADNDVGRAGGNIGVEKATEAAAAVGGLLAVPPAHEGRSTDFNDLHAARGLEAVRLAVEARREAEALPLPESSKQSASGREKPARTLRCLNIEDFIGKTYPPRETLLSPVLAVQSLMMVFAMRGLGKTYFALSVALAVASGGKVFGRWEAFRPARVLYLDGEMPAVTLQERIGKIVEGGDFDITDPDMLRIITPDEQADPMPNLATRAGQEAVEPHLEGVSLVILDNLATLTRTGKANDEDGWSPVQEWLLSLRRRGISVLLVHHAGKNGQQRGTGAKEDILDTVIELRRPADYRADEGARFEVHFTKARGLFGSDAEPFEVRLHTADSGGYEWHTRPVVQAQMEQVRDLFDLGMSVREVAEETGLSRSKVHRFRQKLEADGTTFPHAKNQWG